MRAKLIKEESISDLLTPKSNEEIIEVFKSLSIVKKIDFLADYEDRKIIPFNLWPLLQQIKEKLKQNVNFDNYFRVTYTDVLANHKREYFAAQFKIYNRNDDWNIFFSVKQFNGYENNVVLDTHNQDKNYDITSYEQFVKIFNSLSKK